MGYFYFSQCLHNSTDIQNVRMELFYTFYPFTLDMSHPLKESFRQT